MLALRRGVFRKMRELEEANRQACKRKQGEAWCLAVQAAEWSGDGGKRVVGSVGEWNSRVERDDNSEIERPMSSLTSNTRLSHTPAQEESAHRLPLSPSQRLSNISLHICAALAFALGRPDPRDARQCAPTGPTNTTNERHQHLRPNRDGRMNNRVECCTLPCAVLTSTPDPASSPASRASDNN